MADASATSLFASERSIFNGLLVAALAYGSLLMLYAQLTQVLLSRPKRGKMYWVIVGYSSLLFLFATMAIGGMLRFAQMAFVDNRMNDGGPAVFWYAHMTNRINIMSQIGSLLMAWIGDLLMLYRVFVIWNSNKLILVLPGLLWAGTIGMSLPLVIHLSRLPNVPPFLASSTFTTALYALCVSFNLFIAAAISLRIFSMRRKVEEIMGTLHASFYTGFVTIIVESGAFFTLWGMTYLILLACNHDSKETVLLPYTHVLGLTRMLIVLRIAQDRAWSKELASASTDWHVSSTHSIPLHDVPASSEVSTLPRFRSHDSLPRKYEHPL